MIHENDYNKLLLENEFLVFHKHDTVHFKDKAHYHNGFEVHFTLTNATTYQIEGRVYTVDSGTIALFSPEEIHRVSIDRSKLYERYVLLFKPSFIEEFTKNHGDLLDLYSRIDCIQLKNEDMTKMIQLFDELIEIKDEKSSMNPVYKKIKLTEILLLIDYLSEHKPNQIPSTLENQNDLLTEIMSHIRQNDIKNLTLNSLSKKYSVSKSTLMRIFKRGLGITPNQYIIYSKIMKSRELLAEGYKVKEVSALIGYRNESSYIKKFKELQGESPKQYSQNISKSKILEKSNTS